MANKRREHLDEIVALATFDKNYLKPAERDYANEERPGLRNYYFGELIEGYAWLLLGLELGVFPELQTFALIAQRFYAVLPFVDRYFSEWGFLFDMELQDLMAAAKATKRIPVSKKFKQPNTLRGSFQSVLLLESKFSKDISARAFVSWINFYERDVLHALAFGKFDSLEVNLGVPKGTFLEGFLASIDHMARFGYFIEHLRLSQRIELGDQQSFVRDVKRARGWRLNFGTMRAQQIFLSMSNDLAKYLPGELLASFDEWTFTRELRALMHEWGMEGGATRDAGV